MKILDSKRCHINQHFQSDDYQLQEKIGQGGFGSVYKAKKRNTDQVVAIKFLTLPTEFDNDKKRRYIERFERETLLGSRLQHPNIVRLLDKDCSNDNLLYAVFEYVEGDSLKDRLRKSGPLLPVEAADVMAQVLDALTHAHEQGVIHRDIKPANIMLSKTGAKIHTKILDFGIGTLAKEARNIEYKTLTLTQETLGTPSYSAPEQLRGEPPTSQTDLYVWGLVFIECLTGQAVISGASLASIFHKQLSQSQVPLPPAIAAHPVSALLRRVLNKNIIDRANSAADVYREFKKHNFSSLVGDLQNRTHDGQIPPIRDSALRHNDTAESLTNTTLCSSDETMIYDCGMLFTGLTERKLISALCITLSVRSLSDSIDHEVIDALYRDQKSQATDIAIRYGAYHVGTLADTLLFYFGYPTVSDNDARLCARSALEINSRLLNRNALLKQSQGFEITISMGIHTSKTMHYGDAVPEGDTANTAIELARLAKNNQILCSHSSTYRLDSFVEFKTNNCHRIGISQTPQETSFLIGERQFEALGFLRSNHGVHDFVGREVELSTLVDFLQQDQTNRVLAHIHGEAGIGKSRLVYELKRNAVDYKVHISQCLPEYQNSALHPILKLVRSLFSIDTLTDSEAVIKLKEVLEGQAQNNSISGLQNSVNTDQAIPLLCTWLNLPLPNHLSPLTEDPETQKEILFHTLGILLIESHKDNIKHTLRQRKLFIIEDLHWCDPTTTDFISSLASTPLFKQSNHRIISTSRKPPPQNLTKLNICSTEILPLNHTKASQFVRNLFNHKNLSDDVVEVIIKRTDGIPLYTEELVNMLEQNGWLKHVNGTIDFSPNSHLEQLPSNLLEVLQQNLDTLKYAKETAQLAATIGREFDYSLLSASSRHSEQQLQLDLQELIDRELIYLQRKVQGDYYLFKHALVRDAAYEGMGNESRIHNHNIIAQTLENKFPNRSEHEPAILAKHYAKSGDYSKAINFGKPAIHRLIKNSSNKEALILGDEIKNWITQLSNTNDKRKSLLQFNDAILPVKTMFEGWGSNGIKTLAKENLQLINEIRSSSDGTTTPKQLNDYEHRSERTLLLFHHYQNNRSEARSLGETLLKKACQENSRTKELIVLTILGQAYFFDGDFEKSKKALKRSVEIYDMKRDRHIYIEFGFDPYHFSAGNLMCIEALMGHHDDAIKYHDMCLNHAEATENTAIIITAYTFATCLYFVLNDRDGMRRCCNQAINKYGSNIQSNWIHKYFYMMYDWTNYDYMRPQRTVFEETKAGQDSFLSWYEPSLSNTYVHHGMFDEAIKLMKNSLTRSTRSGESCILSIAYRYLALAQFHQSGKLDSLSIDNFKHAISESKNRDSKWLEFLATFEYLQCMNTDKPGHKDKVLTKRMEALIESMSGIDNNAWVIKYKAIYNNNENGKNGTRF